ncbi:hypothetical protein ABG067_008127 [Albugo candida]
MFQLLSTLHLARKLSFKKDYIKGNIDSDLVWEVAHYIKNRPLFIEHDITLADRGIWEQHNGYNNPATVDTDDTEEATNNGEASNLDDINHTSNPTVDADEVDPSIDNSGNDIDDSDSPVNVLASDSLIDNNISVRLAPGEGRTPISLIKDKDSDFLSFIKIFCGEKLDA